MQKTSPTSSLPPSKPPPTPSYLTTLPAELLHLIASCLPYPDLLALKHTSRLFSSLITPCGSSSSNSNSSNSRSSSATSIRCKVSWLVSRAERGLAIPRNKCVLKTDEAFVNCDGGEVRRIMERRRRHAECGVNGAGREADGSEWMACEVVLGAKCEGPRKEMGMMRGRIMGWGWDKGKRGGFADIYWVVAMALVGVGVVLVRCIRGYG